MSLDGFQTLIMLSSRSNSRNTSSNAAFAPAWSTVHAVSFSSDPIVRPARSTSFGADSGAGDEQPIAASVRITAAREDSLFTRPFERLLQPPQRRLRADEQVVGEDAVLEDLVVDRVALVEVDAHAGEVLQFQVPISVDRRVGCPPLQIAGTAG